MKIGLLRVGPGVDGPGGGERSAVVLRAFDGEATNGEDYIFPDKASAKHPDRALFLRLRRGGTVGTAICSSTNGAWLVSGGLGGLGGPGGVGGGRGTGERWG